MNRLRLWFVHGESLVNEISFIVAAFSADDAVATLKADQPHLKNVKALFEHERASIIDTIREKNRG